MAGALAVLLPLALALLAFTWRLRWFENALAVVACIAMLGVLVLTQSRGVWMGLAAAALVLIALRWRWGWLALPLAAMAAWLIAWRIGFDRVAEAILTFRR